MPFDKPRLYPHDGTFGDAGAERSVGEGPAADDLALPAELRILESRLRGEADMLAERHSPAAQISSPDPSEIVRGRLNRRLLWTACLATAASLALMVWQFERPQDRVPPGNAIVNHSSPTSAPPAQPANSVSADNRVTQGRARPSGAEASELRHTQGIAEVGIEAPAAERHPPANQLEMLRMQLTGFEKVIQKLQTELAARDAAQIQSQRQIESLQTEVADLHKQLSERRSGAPDRR
jgi:hypothetical protein